MPRLREGNTKGPLNSFSGLKSTLLIHLWTNDLFRGDRFSSDFNKTQELTTAMFVGLISKSADEQKKVIFSIFNY